MWASNCKEMMKFQNMAHNTVFFPFAIATFFDVLSCMVLLLLHQFDPMVKLMAVSFNIMVSNE